MKKLLLMLLGVLMTLPMVARDFEYTYEGQTLTYTVISEDDKTCMTKEGDSWGPGNKVEGDLVIPAVAIDGENEYTVTVIGEGTFNSCTGLSSISIPNSVTTIGSHAFKRCTSLTSIKIPNSVTTIGGLAFFCCTSLTSIKIPNSVTTIGGEAFRDCTSLTSIEIPNSVTGIAFDAFSGCTSLTSVEIPNSVTFIGDDAFSGCTSLTSVEIPNSVTAIGKYAFRNCNSLTSINVAIGNPNYSSADGVLFSKDYSLLIHCPGRKIGEYVIPNFVTTIEAYAFSSCTSLTSVVIPNSVTSIGDCAFWTCSSLTSVEISDSVTSIGDLAFRDCSSLTSVVIPNSVTSIGARAFYSCTSLTSINVGLENPNYSSADGVLFSKDYSVLIQCPGGKIGEYVIPNSVTNIGGTAFYYCSSLTSVVIPNSVTYIGNEAFNRCTSLTSVKIPNSVTTIGDYAFSSCTSLISVEIPNSVTTIGDYAFCYCNGLVSVFYNTIEPIEKGYPSIFHYETYPKATLYVPAAAVEKCKLIDPWKNFSSIVAYDFTGINDVSVDIDGDVPCEVYTTGGVKIGDSTDGLVPGIYIVRQGNDVKKIAVN